MDFGTAVDVLWKRFEPNGKREKYAEEFQLRKKAVRMK